MQRSLPAIAWRVVAFGEDAAASAGNTVQVGDLGEQID
jgi:hypothetical protein